MKTSILVSFHTYLLSHQVLPVLGIKYTGSVHPTRYDLRRRRNWQKHKPRCLSERFGTTIGEGGLDHRAAIGIIIVKEIEIATGKGIETAIATETENALLEVLVHLIEIIAVLTAALRVTIGELELISN